jgi:hypothetical protein
LRVVNVQRWEELKRIELGRSSEVLVLLQFGCGSCCWGSTGAINELVDKTRFAKSISRFYDEPISFKA